MHFVYIILRKIDNLCLEMLFPFIFLAPRVLKEQFGYVPVFASFSASLFTLFPLVNVQIIDNVTYIGVYAIE